MNTVIAESIGRRMKDMDRATAPLQRDIANRLIGYLQGLNMGDLISDADFNRLTGIVEGVLDKIRLDEVFGTK